MNKILQQIAAKIIQYEIYGKDHVTIYHRLHGNIFD